MTNIEFVQYVMEIGGTTGEMKQMVIMQAIPEYCQQVIDQKEELLKKEEEDLKEGNVAMISTTAWIAAAEEIKEMFSESVEEPASGDLVKRMINNDFETTPQLDNTQPTLEYLKEINHIKIPKKYNIMED